MSYRAYRDYLEALDKFYQIVADPQYEHKYLPDGTMKYHLKDQKEETVLVPPILVSRGQYIDQLEEEKKQLMVQLVDLKAEILNCSFEQVDRSTIQTFDSLTSQIEELNSQINHLEQIEDHQLESSYYELVIQRGELLEKLDTLLEERQSYYTFEGQTLSDYQTWKEEWMESEQHQKWVEVNEQYYDTLKQLKDLDKEIALITEELAQMETFQSFYLLRPPEVAVQIIKKPTLKLKKKGKESKPKPKLKLKPKPKKTALDQLTQIIEESGTPIEFIKIRNKLTSLKRKDSAVADLIEQTGMKQVEIARTIVQRHEESNFLG